MACEKKFPLSAAELESLVKRFPTPFHIYDETGIRAAAASLKQAFSVCSGFREYYAVKACPNPFILKILADEGFGADCSSGPEITLAERSGLKGEMLMFTSNDTPAAEFVQAAKAGAVINFDDISHIDFCEKALRAAGLPGLPALACCRYNPGPLKEGNAIIGKPEEAKYGFTREQLLEGYADLKKRGVKRFGLHTMVASNELSNDYFIETARILFDRVLEISRAVGIDFEFVNLGGGFGIPYRPEQTAIDLPCVARGVRKAYEEIILGNGLKPLSVFMESGRMITGPHGWLVTRVIHRKSVYREYVGTDASMADLMRPALYGAYHHISVPGKETAPADKVYDVTGSLCENNDKFAIQRSLPEIRPGDLLVIHDAGAHGRAMCFNYNGKLRSGELLLREDGSVTEIRRKETVEDYFATLDFSALGRFDVRSSANGGRKA
jgi:diaminopimelate decarboxylase